MSEKTPSSPKSQFDTSRPRNTWMRETRVKLGPHRVHQLSSRDSKLDHGGHTEITSCSSGNRPHAGSGHHCRGISQSSPGRGPACQRSDRNGRLSVFCLFQFDIESAPTHSTRIDRHAVRSCIEYRRCCGRCPLRPESHSDDPCSSARERCQHASGAHCIRFFSQVQFQLMLLCMPRPWLP